MASANISVVGNGGKLDPTLALLPVLVGVAVFSACIFGILTRPVGFLATIWPANAVLLGLLIRLPRTRDAAVWLWAAAAYMAADLIAGTGFQKALLLNTANLCGIGLAWLACRYLPKDALRLRDPASALYIVLVCAVAAAGAAVVAALADPLVLNVGGRDAFTFWFATELANYIAVLPILLAVPNPRRWGAGWRALRVTWTMRTAVPAIALVVSCALATAIGGPGAIAFAVPALLWCGLTYSVFGVSIFAFVFSCWSMTFMSAAYLHDVAGGFDNHALASMRLAAFMIALAPLTLSIVMRNRADLISRLSRARQRVDLALDAGGIVAAWSLDPASTDLSAEGRFPRFPDAEDENGRDTFGRALSWLIHPDDRARVQNALDLAHAIGTDFQCRYRAITPTGEVRRFAAFGKPVQEAGAVTTRLVGILIDVTERAEATDALQQSNTRFNIVSESIPQIVWSTDAAGRHDYFNSRWSEFTGIARDDIGPETWKGLVHPDDESRVQQVWTACLATGNTYSIDYRFRYRDGGYRWLRVLAKPLRNADGTITRWYGTSTDIDDAKQLEAEREIVARELDHRIGNLFALVNGLVSLAARDGSDVKTVMDALRGRVKALHDAHSLVRRDQNTGSATMTAVLRRLLAPYDSGDERIVIVGDDLVVDPVAMTSIALLFHELATNAAKYGAFRDSDGRLRIELRRAGDRFTIRWLETAHGRPDHGNGAGFGSRLFDTIVQGQLQGRATRAVSDRGLSIELDLPVQLLSIR